MTPGITKVAGDFVARLYVYDSFFRSRLETCSTFNDLLHICR